MSESLTSQRRNISPDTLLQTLTDKIPALGIIIKGAELTRELIDQVTEVIRKNISLLAGSTFITAGFLTLLPTLITVTVNALGFTAAGVLQGNTKLQCLPPIYTNSPNFFY